MKQTVYVLGNPLDSHDRLPMKLLPQLRERCPQFYFTLLDPTEEMSVEKNQNLILIDTVFGIDKVTVFKGLSSFSLSPRVTVHDYDLPLSLGLLTKLGKIENVTVIGVPPEGNETGILQEIGNVLYIHFTFKK